MPPNLPSKSFAFGLERISSLLNTDSQCPSPFTGEPRQYLSVT